MSEHTSTIEWERGDRAFEYETFTRNHVWRFANGVALEASSAPDFLGDASRVDPEAGLVAAISSCHMLTFLAIAARKRLVVERYRDEAVGTLEKNADGKLAITRVVLHPHVEFAGDAPDAAQLERLHHQAHVNCFIANSIKTDVRVEGVGD